MASLLIKWNKSLISVCMPCPKCTCFSLTLNLPISTAHQEKYVALRENAVNENGLKHLSVSKYFAFPGWPVSLIGSHCLSVNAGVGNE